MIDEVSRQLRDSKNLTFYPLWLNMAAKWLVSKFNFRELHNIISSPLVTVASTRTYTLDSTLYRLFNVWIPGIPRRLDPTNEITLLGQDPKFNTFTGPIYKYIWRGSEIDFWRVPDGAYSVYYSFFKAPKTIVSGDTTEYPSFPGAWHEYLVQRAITRGFKYENNPQWADSELLERKLLAELKPTLVNLPGMFHVLESEATGMQAAKPILPPDHFPRIN